MKINLTSKIKNFFRIVIFAVFACSLQAIDLSAQNSIVIQQLSDNDWALWKTMSLAAAKETPEYFATTYAIEAARSDLYWQEQCSQYNVFCAFCNGKPAGVVELMVLGNSSTKAGVFGWLYVMPEYRRNGIASALMQHVIDYAKTVKGCLTLTSLVARNNEPSLKLHEKYGFANIWYIPSFTFTMRQLRFA